MYAKRLILENESSMTLTHEKTRGISINKYLADANIASRRASEAIIKDGRVTIDGITATLGDRVYPNNVVKLDDKIIEPLTEKVYFLLNKPSGIVCTVEPLPDNIKDFMHLDYTIFPVGRLDKDSEGLIIMTNDGDIVNKILRSEFGHEKEYLVKVDKPIDDAFIEQMSKGVVIYNQKRNSYQMTDPCEIKKLDDDTFTIILKQGLNRQIRRMTQALSYKVLELTRVRIMHLTLEDLPVGYYRALTDNELKQLNEQLIDMK